MRLLTPNDWEQRHRGDHWPVLYLLHGCCDTYDSWIRSVGDGTARPFDPPGVVDELEAELSVQNHLVAARMERVGVPLATDFYGPGTHTWPYWERELHRSLPMLLRALRGGRAAA